MTFYRIKEYKISARGQRGAIISIPAIAMKNLGVNIGSKLSLYQGTISGHPVLVLANTDAVSIETPDQGDPRGAA